MSERWKRFQAPRAGRLDLILVEGLSSFSRNQLQTLVREGCVTVDESVVTKSGFGLQGGEQIAVLLPKPKPMRLEPEAIPLQIVFENQDLIVIDKPAGMVVHPSPGHERGTLVHAVLAHAPDIRGVGGELRPGVVHRLDKDTSGLLMMAKHDRAHRHLQRQFKDRLVEKIYLALVDGQPPTLEGRIEASLGRDPRARKKIAIVPASRGRAAVTTYRTLERFEQHSYMELRPETGRTHQIRVHLAFLGCPVAGDRVYGHRSVSIRLGRHFLHASELKLQLPGDPRLRSFKAPLPVELQEVLEGLRRQH